MVVVSNSSNDSIPHQQKNRYKSKGKALERGCTFINISIALLRYVMVWFHYRLLCVVHEIVG